MIPINQLRIGSKFIGIAGVQTVKEILQHGDKDIHTNEGYHHLILVEENRNQYKPIEIEGIRLNEDILVNVFNFYKYDNFQYPYFTYLDFFILEGQPDGTFMIQLTNSSGEYNTTVDVQKVAYVHQLQNWLVFLLYGDNHFNFDNNKLNKCAEKQINSFLNLPYPPFEEMEEENN